MDHDQEGLFGPVYRLTVNGEQHPGATFQEVRALVAELVTGWLGEDPEGLALDAQTLNLAFNTGAVQEALDLRGEWFTMLGVHSEHQTMQLKVTREG